MTAIRVRGTVPSMRDSDLIDAIRDAASTVRAGTRMSVLSYFEERPELPVAGEVQYAIGVIDGAAIALDMTASELLSDLGIDDG